MRKFIKIYLNKFNIYVHYKYPDKYFWRGQYELFKQFVRVFRKYKC